MTVIVCKLCAGDAQIPAPALYQFPTITSDCRPWSTGRAVAVCPQCGFMQRALLPDAATRMADVYTNYEMFKHSNAASDQLTFNMQGIPQARTQKILGFIESKLTGVPASVLDVGSGSGAGLVALATQFPQANIYGFEPNDKPAERQATLPSNVISIATQLPAASEKYDLITLFHVLEHVEEVFDLLAFIAKALTPTGTLLIQVPYPVTNPFDYVISDHVWHFTKHTMASLLRKANFNVTYIGNALIDKELTVLARPGKADASSAEDTESKAAINAMDWLVDYKYFLDQLKREAQPLAVYGTGPSGAWAGYILGDLVTAYIDDDPARIGSSFNGKPVVSAQKIERGLRVVAPFPDNQFRWIAEKNKDLNIVKAA